MPWNSGCWGASEKKAVKGKFSFTTDEEEEEEPCWLTIDMNFSHLASTCSKQKYCAVSHV